MVVNGSILNRFKIILNRSINSFVINSLDFVKSKFLSSLIFLGLFYPLIITSESSAVSGWRPDVSLVSVYQVLYRKKACSSNDPSNPELPGNTRQWKQNCENARETTTICPVIRCPQAIFYDNDVRIRYSQFFKRPFLYAA